MAKPGELDLQLVPALGRQRRERRSGRSRRSRSTRVSPVATFWTVTVAPGSTACCASSTTPSMSNVGFWASAGRGTRTAAEQRTVSNAPTATLRIRVTRHLLVRGRGLCNPADASRSLGDARVAGARLHGSWARSGKGIKRTGVRTKADRSVSNACDRRDRKDRRERICALCVLCGRNRRRGSLSRP